MRSRLLLLAVVLPLLGLVALIVRAELAVRSGASFVVPITGYDPRDLISGHYLRFRYVWRGRSKGGCVAGDCCLCLTREDEVGEDPPTRNVSCDEVATCDAWLHATAVDGPQKFFVPEERAPQLEAALRDRDAAIRLTCGADGRPAIEELLLDGRPWRETLP